MKNRLFLIAAGFLLFTACTKQVTPAGNTVTVNIIPATAVPQSVVSSFTASFGTASEIEWQHSSDDNFICQFNMDDQRHEARFDDSGHQSSHSIICIDAPVPGLVLTAFRNDFPGDNVYEWNLTNEGNWKAHFMRSNIKWEVTYGNAGTILKTEHD